MGYFAFLKNATGIDTSIFTKKANLVSFKSDGCELDIDKLKNVPNNLSSIKSKVDKLYFDKMVLVPVD